MTQSIERGECTQLLLACASGSPGSTAQSSVLCGSGVVSCVVRAVPGLLILFASLRVRPQETITIGVTNGSTPSPACREPGARPRRQETFLRILSYRLIQLGQCYWPYPRVCWRTLSGLGFCITRPLNALRPISLFEIHTFALGLCL